MKLHVGVLGKRQVRLLPRLGPVLKERGFYLAGGTALAAPKQIPRARQASFEQATSCNFDYFPCVKQSQHPE